MANSCSRHRMTVDAFISGQAKANGKREYSSMAVNRYLLCVTDGNGPLKSILSLSKGCVALIRLFNAGLKNFGLSLAHVLH